MCSEKAMGASDCRSIRFKEKEVYDAFMMMLGRLQNNRKYLVGTLINQIETMQNRADGNGQIFEKIDKEIADLASRNLVIARLHSKGILNASDYSAQSSEINNKITELRIERRKKISENDSDEMLDELKIFDDILEKADIGFDFQEELMEQTVVGIQAIDNAQLKFKLLGGIELTEEIREKGRCGSK